MYTYIYMYIYILYMLYKGYLSPPNAMGVIYRIISVKVVVYSNDTEKINSKIGDGDCTHWMILGGSHYTVIIVASQIQCVFFFIISTKQTYVAFLWSYPNII